MVDRMAAGDVQGDDVGRQALTPEMAERIRSRGTRMLEGYYIHFEPTGNDAIDLVLGAVALAGRSYHSTESWSDISEYDDHDYSLTDLIQRAANSAAAASGSEEDA